MITTKYPVVHARRLAGLQGRLHAGVERRMSIDGSNISTREPTDNVMNDHYKVSCSPCSQARWTPGKLHAGVERRMSIDGSNTSTREPTDEIMNDHYKVSCSPCSQARWTPGELHAGVERRMSIDDSNTSTREPTDNVMNDNYRISVVHARKLAGLQEKLDSRKSRTSKKMTCQNNPLPHK